MSNETRTLLPAQGGSGLMHGEVDFDSDILAVALKWRSFIPWSLAAVYIHWASMRMAEKSCG